MLDRDNFEEYLDGFDEMVEDLNLKLNSGMFSIAERKANRLLDEERDIDVDKSSQEYWKLCAGIIRAMIKGIEYKKKRLLGEFSDDLEHTMDQSLSTKSEQLINLPMTDAPQAERTEQVVDRSNSSQPKNKKLSEVIPLFVDEMKIRWEPKTKSEMEA